MCLIFIHFYSAWSPLVELIKFSLVNRSERKKTFSSWFGWSIIPNWTLIWNFKRLKSFFASVKIYHFLYLVCNLGKTCLNPYHQVALIWSILHSFFQNIWFNLSLVNFEIVYEKWGFINDAISLLEIKEQNHRNFKTRIANKSKG